MRLSRLEDDQAAFCKASLVHIDRIGTAGLGFDAEHLGKIVGGKKIFVGFHCKDNDVLKILGHPDAKLTAPHRIANINTVAVQVRIHIV